MTRRYSSDTTCQVQSSKIREGKATVVFAVNGGDEGRQSPAALKEKLQNYRTELEMN